jgi:hypothetical protein
LVSAVGVVAVGLYVSGMMVIGVGLSATGVSVGGGPVLLCVPAPTIAALVLAAYIWRRR